MFHSLIETRRSIRKFLKKPVEPEKIEKLVETALRAPSSHDRNPWEFIVVTDPQLMEKLSHAKEHGSDFLKGAPLGIVVLADPAKCDVWIEDASIASTFILLAAHDMGLGGCWIQIRERVHNQEKSAEEYVRDVLHIPPNLKVESMIAIGYPDEKKRPHPRETLQFEKVHRNGYGQP
ncbi:MAG: nitroreductase family protein [Dehalococcoidia bacterium]|nr:nitroreductase family protein [Dehalococcoidia bacterium]